MFEVNVGETSVNHYSQYATNVTNTLPKPDNCNVPAATKLISLHYCARVYGGHIEYNI